MKIPTYKVAADLKGHQLLASYGCCLEKVFTNYTSMTEPSDVDCRCQSLTEENGGISNRSIVTI